MNARAAASCARVGVLGDSPLDFGEELAGDVGFAAGGTADVGGDGMGDGLLVACQIWNGCVKGIFAEMLSQLIAVDLMVLASLLVTRDHVPQQAKLRIVVSAYILDRLSDLDDTLSAPICRFQRDNCKIRCRESGESGQREFGGTIEQKEVVPPANVGDKIDKGKVEVSLLSLALVCEIKGLQSRPGGMTST